MCEKREKGTIGAKTVATVLPNTVFELALIVTQDNREIYTLAMSHDEFMALYHVGRVKRA